MSWSRSASRSPRPAGCSSTAARSPSPTCPARARRWRCDAVVRPQRVPGAPLRFLLDVHLGTLARRLRLLGVDAAYESEDIGDPALAALSAQERRVLLSRDRGLLRRRELWAGAYIYSDRPDDQLRDVLDRFAPALAPVDPLHGLQRAAGARPTRTRSRERLEHGHAAHVRRLRAVRGLRAGVLAGRAPRPAGGDRRGGGAGVRRGGRPVGVTPSGRMVRRSRKSGSCPCDPAHD